VLAGVWLGGLVGNWSYEVLDGVRRIKVAASLHLSRALLRIIHVDLFQLRNTLKLTVQVEFVNIQGIRCEDEVNGISLLLDPLFTVVAVDFKVDVNNPWVTISINSNSYRIVWWIKDVKEGSLLQSLNGIAFVLS
jgi:hypothetical protein